VVAEWHNITLLFADRLYGVRSSQRRRIRVSQVADIEMRATQKLYYTRILCPEIHASHYRATAPWSSRANQIIHLLLKTRTDRHGQSSQAAAAAI